MVNMIERARAAARQAQELLYDGRATVKERQKVKDPKTKIMHEQDVIVLENEPCRLSYSKVSAAEQTESVAKTAQTITLFLSPDASIKPGAEITVTQAGATATYECSGVPAVYATHQEIILTLKGGYA